MVDLFSSLWDSLPEIQIRNHLENVERLSLSNILKLTKKLFVLF